MKCWGSLRGALQRTSDCGFRWNLRLQEPSSSLLTPQRVKFYSVCALASSYLLTEDRQWMSRPSLLHKCQVTHTPQVRSQALDLDQKDRPWPSWHSLAPRPSRRGESLWAWFLPSAVEEVARKKRNRENENREGEQEAAINVGREEGHSRF